MKHEKKLTKAQIWNRYWVPAIEATGEFLAFAAVVSLFVFAAGIAILAA